MSFADTYFLSLFLTSQHHDMTSDDRKMPLYFLCYGMSTFLINCYNYCDCKYIIFPQKNQTQNRAQEVTDLKQVNVCRGTFLNACNMHSLKMI